VPEEEEETAPGAEAVPEEREVAAAEDPAVMR
jgi:hypothetical protein